MLWQRGIECKPAGRWHRLLRFVDVPWRRRTRRAGNCARLSI